MLGFNVKYAILNGGRSRAGIEVRANTRACAGAT